MNKDLARQLSNAFGPSGFEDGAAEVICGKLDSLSVKYKRDKMGNIIVHLLKGKESDKRVLLDAHMDEVGLLVQHINPQGFIKVVNLGGLVPVTLVAKLLKFKTDKGSFVYGVTSTVPPHVNNSSESKIEIKDLWIDVGASSAEEVRNMGIRVGTPGLMHFDFLEINDTRVMGKAFDDRIGCLMILEVIEDFVAGKWTPKNLDIHASFSVQEEVGLRGVGAVIEEVNPDQFFALEGTICADVPGVSEEMKINQLEKGPSLTVMDRSVITPKPLIDYAISEAVKAGIPFQIKTPAFGGTNSGAVHTMKKGIPSLSMATPCRYIHTQASMLSTKDFDHGKELLKILVNNINSL